MHSRMQAGASPLFLSSARIYGRWGRMDLWVRFLAQQVNIGTYFSGVDRDDGLMLAEQTTGIGDVAEGVLRLSVKRVGATIPKTPASVAWWGLFPSSSAVERAAVNR